MSVFYRHPLPLPLGEVAEQSEDGEGRPGAKPSQSPSVTALPKGEVDERSEDGEGKPGCNALSVAYGDSSPKGRAKGGCTATRKMARISLASPLGRGG